MAEENSEDIEPFDSDAQYEPEPEPMEQQEEAEEQQQPQQRPPQPRGEGGRFLPGTRRPQRRQRPQMTPQMAAATAAPMPQQQQANPQAQAPVARFIPYEFPKRIGLFDRETGKPVIESDNMMQVILAQLADIKNDLEEIKAFYQ